MDADSIVSAASIQQIERRNEFDNVPSVSTEFAPWIKLGAESRGGTCAGATVVFPHAGGAAASYRSLATALADGGDTYIVQYPQRADRLSRPCADTVHDLARGLVRGRDWESAAPLRLFGHCMGAVVAFEFARIAERKEQRCGGCGLLPVRLRRRRRMPDLPTSDDGLLADIVDLGGTDPVLLADEEFAELLVNAVRADYRALNRYSCAPGVRIRADIHAVGGRDDHRVDAGCLQAGKPHRWRLRAVVYDGGHFYLNDHIDAVAARVNADV